MKIPGSAGCRVLFLLTTLCGFAIAQEAEPDAIKPGDVLIVRVPSVTPTAKARAVHQDSIPHRTFVVLVDPDGCATLPVFGYLNVQDIGLDLILNLLEHCYEDALSGGGGLYEPVKEPRKLVSVERLTLH